MSYLAIARKYRPTTFDEIVGQEHVTRTLKNAIRRNRIHHAFLFCGARGVGKTTAARALAQALNCSEGPTSEPCDNCTSCLEIRSGTSPDLIEIDGASNNSVDDIRDLRETVKYAPTQGAYKIYLVDEVHMLSKAAFNALLKTLEEPPSHVIFLFATTEPNKIPDTILSRVQRFDFLRIPSAAVVARLASIAASEGATISENALRLIAHAGEGSMRDSQSLLDKVIAFAGPDISDEEVAETLGLIDRTLLYLMLEGLVSGAPEKCLQAIDQVYGYGFELSQFTTEMLELTRNATFLRLSEASHRYVDLSGEEREQLIRIVEHVEPQSLSRIFTALLDVHDQVARASRPRIVLEMAVARMAITRPLHPIGELVERLHDLERKLRHQGGRASIRPMSTSARSRSPRRHPSKSSDNQDDDSSSRPSSQSSVSADSVSSEAATPPPAVHPPTPVPPPTSADPKPTVVPSAEAIAPTTSVDASEPVKTPKTSNRPAETKSQRKPAPNDHVKPTVPTTTVPTAAAPTEPRHDVNPSAKAPSTSSTTPASQHRTAAPSSSFPSLRERLAREGRVGEAIATAEWTTVDRTIRVALVGAVLVAKGRRLIKRPDLATTIRAAIGERQQLEVIELPSQQARSDEEASLQNQFLTDPRIQRMMTLFDAELIDVDKSH